MSPTQTPISDAHVLVSHLSGEKLALLGSLYEVYDNELGVLLARLPLGTRLWAETYELVVKTPSGLRLTALGAACAALAALAALAA